MAKASIAIIEALRNTAIRLEQSGQYQWGHMGLCNCGFLAQEITHLGKKEIHQRAMCRNGDWHEQLNDYCPASGLLIDDIIQAMLSIGFDREDLIHLERLSDPAILCELNPLARNLQYNSKTDVILYLHTWADKLAAEMLQSILLADLTKTLQWKSEEHTILRGVFLIDESEPFRKHGFNHQTCLD
jgi:hypothetical protein